MAEIVRIYSFDGDDEVIVPGIALDQPKETR